MILVVVGVTQGRRGGGGDVNRSQLTTHRCAFQKRGDVTQNWPGRLAGCLLPSSPIRFEICRVCLSWGWRWVGTMAGTNPLGLLILLVIEWQHCTACENMGAVPSAELGTGHGGVNSDHNSPYRIAAYQFDRQAHEA